MLKIIIAAQALILSGCGTTSRVQTINVPIPIACQAEVPTKPAWPTDTLKAQLPSLPKDEILDRFVAATTAEIELREGYEGRLLAALESCITTPKD